MDLLSEGVPVQAQQFCCLDLISFGFLKRPGDQGTLNGIDQHGMQVPSRTVSHPLHEISHLPFEIVLKRQGIFPVRSCRLLARDHLHELGGSLQYGSRTGDHQCVREINVGWYGGGPIG